MKCESEIRELLISNAIHLIAEGGFEKATTKELTFCSGHLPGIKMNEAYVYRIFGNKERLYEAAFLRLDSELFQSFQKALKAMKAHEGSLKEKLYELFIITWEFILGNEERFRCYVRYYYSVYFRGSSLESHNKLFKEIVDEASVFFKEEADVGSILHGVFFALFDFAIRVYNGDLEDSEINRPHVFNVLCCMMMSYFKDNIL